MIRSVELEPVGSEAYPFSIPAIRALRRLELDPHVTLLTGENGSGKSTLVEAIAIAAGFNPEGGSADMRHVTAASHSELHAHVRLVRDARPQHDGFFLRAESFYNVATHVEELGVSGYGDVPLHAQSHGESFLSLVLERFRPNGFYVLDEPEAALSVRGVLALIRRLHELVEAGAQFLVSTHSPILLAYPGARIYALDEHGIAETAWEDTEVVDLTRSFLADRHRFLHYLFAEPA
ncbi:MAG: AAA family ATPase [Actinomycetota bacterium]